MASCGVSNIWCILLTVIVLSFLILCGWADEHRRRLGAGECKSDNYMKGVVFSLFGTIHALNHMKQQNLYQLDWVLASGTLLALRRNSPIFPWDSDADLLLIFQDDLNQTQLVDFLSVLSKQIEVVLGNRSRAFSAWTFPKADEKIVHHSFFVRALNDSEGWTDVFILFHDESKQRLKAYQPHLRTLTRWQNKSLIFPIRHNVRWQHYDDMKVNVVHHTETYLEMAYGANWRVPNVGRSRMSCRNVNASIVREWMHEINEWSARQRDSEPRQKHTKYNEYAISRRMNDEW
eukprot:CAMPEP_0197044732 /NCGR_PEP_ID=MMETSP1384-20130603/20723_1 /TAXON_ID=29189 /ORGANISM="Ammonia sp." /LENGTH=289 /DNA_ID=CAMNT_0042476241 /DNA_START=31 /DNA_END=897 /DNA_ORIENTATION=-